MVKCGIMISQFYALSQFVTFTLQGGVGVATWQAQGFKRRKFWIYKW